MVRKSCVTATKNSESKTNELFEIDANVCIPFVIDAYGVMVKYVANGGANPAITIASCEFNVKVDVNVVDE